MTDQPEVPEWNAAALFEGLEAALHARQRHGATAEEIAEPALEACRRLCQAGAIDEIPAALAIAGRVSELAQSISRERLPRIVVNEYLVRRQQIDPRHVMEWEARESDAFAPIAEHALDPLALPRVVKTIEQSVLASRVK